MLDHKIGHAFTEPGLTCRISAVHIQHNPELSFSSNL